MTAGVHKLCLPALTPPAQKLADRSARSVCAEKAMISFWGADGTEAYRRPAKEAALLLLCGDRLRFEIDAERLRDACPVFGIGPIEVSQLARDDLSRYAVHRCPDVVKQLLLLIGAHRAEQFSRLAVVVIALAMIVSGRITHDPERRIPIALVFDGAVERVRLVVRIRIGITGEPHGGPLRYPIAIADMTCGMYAAMGILAALLAREKTARGQFIDMALFDSQLTWLANAGSSYLNANVSPKRWGNAHPNIVPYEAYRGSDGKYFVVGVGTEALWKQFVQVMNIQDDIGKDERFTTNALRIKNREILVPLLQNIFQRESAGTWLKKFVQADIPAGPINTVAEAIDDKQTHARGLIVQLEHPAIGTAKSIANPIRFSNTPVSYRLPPPLLGEHTSTILQSLGYGAEEIKQMAAESAA